MILKNFYLLFLFMKILTFFNNKGGVGKTTLIYHIGYKLSQLGYRVLLVDLDPQCNLTAYALDPNQIENLWGYRKSIFYVVEPLITASGDINLDIKPLQLKENLFITPGDINLSIFEDTLSTAWTEVLARRERGFRITFGIYRYLVHWGEKLKLDFVLLDLGPNFGPLNRMAILSCSNYIIPLVPDLFSLRGLMNIGHVIGNWSVDYYFSVTHNKNNVNINKLIPNSLPKFSGYVISQFNIYRNKPTKFFEQWTEEIPHYIQKYVIGELKEAEETLQLREILTIDEPRLLGEFRNMHSLIPKSQEQHKPVFALEVKDGVFGTHVKLKEEADKAAARICENIIKNLYSYS
jgi:cellulose biosynthesis protein BcsQ